MVAEAIVEDLRNKGHFNTFSGNMARSEVG
jgi:hypothetical protein